MARCAKIQSPGRLVTIFGVLVVLVSLAPRDARAEMREATVGVIGGALFPAFKSPVATTPLLVTWVAGVEALYGVTDDLSIRGAFSASRLRGRLDNWTLPNTTYQGTYLFEGAYYHPEVGVRYKAYAGYNLAPHLEADIGYLWAIYSNGIVRATDSAVVRSPDEAGGHFTITGGFALDYRLANTALVGVAIRYTRMLGGVSSGFFSLPVYLSYLW